MAAEGPWNPGLSSTIPDRLMPRATLYDARNATVGWGHARGLSEITGLKPHILATFRPERLAMHHVLIRVTGELHVPDGPNYADLGINLRKMAAAIYSGHIAPHLASIAEKHAALCREAEAIVTRELHDAVLARQVQAEPKRSFLGWLRPKPTVKPVVTRSRDERAIDYVDQHLADTTAGNELQARCQQALARTLSAILSHRGGLLVDESTIVRVATNLISNTAGSELVGRLVAPLFDEGAASLGYHRLPSQTDPVILNATGSSAAGKSSIRHRQWQIASKLGLDGRDFAIISPDYWRKHLIDYSGLGEDYKYAAMLSGQELEIIDVKLDRLLTENAHKGRVPHILVDRFRFDSFQPDSKHPTPAQLLAGLGSRAYLFFLVTPPQETVVRAWRRGLETGRYKAVDDVLFHNIEAYSGMPGLFFYWALREQRWVHYEFLDNSVARGQTPRTIAFGCNGEMVIQDIRAMSNVERYRHVDIEARDAAQVLTRQLSDHEAMAFVRACCDQLDRVDFVLPGSDIIYATARKGEMTVNAYLAPPDFPFDALCDPNLTEASLGTLGSGARADTIGSSTLQ